MNDAPERIGLIGSIFGWRLWTTKDDLGREPDVEYIRADLHQDALDRIAAIEAQVKAADALADDVGKMEQWAAELGFSGGRIGAVLAAYRATKEPANRCCMGLTPEECAAVPSRQCDGMKEGENGTP